MKTSVALVLLMVFILSTTGCAGGRVENWKYKTDTCATKARMHEVVTECKWRHSWLGS